MLGWDLNGDDILVTGWLDFTEHERTWRSDRDRALSHLMREWTYERDYLQRIENLDGDEDAGAESADRENADYFLKLGETVRNDDARDFVTGAGGDDWFFFDPDRDKDTDASDEIFAGDLEWTGA